MQVDRNESQIPEPDFRKISPIFWVYGFDAFKKKMRKH
jgi:hypothetical protein